MASHLQIAEALHKNLVYELAAGEEFWTYASDATISVYTVLGFF